VSKCHLKEFTFDEIITTGEALGVSWDKVDPGEFCMGMHVELEHRDITRGDPILTGKIALAHLAELPDYYTRLAKMERATPKRKRGRR